MKISLAAGILLVTVFIGGGLAVAQSAANITGYAWSENIGWIKLDGPGYGVRLSGNDFYGYAWSENIGWVKFNDISLNDNKLVGKARACAGASNTSACLGDVNPVAGGWDGWISMAGPNYEVRLVADASEPCPLEGWAWGSEVVGWVRFSRSYCAYTPPPVEGIDCGFSANPAWLLYPRSYTTLSWSCEGADACSIDRVGNVDPVSGATGVSIFRTTNFTLSCSNDDGESFVNTIEVKVYDPVYCEIIPSGPGCP